MAFQYKVYVKDDKWRLLAGFFLLEHAVSYAIDHKDNDKRPYKVMNKHKNVHVFPAG
jgi:hypothetical protein